jgi:predicted transcriptional regulator
MAALVGMASIFAGASQALLASVVFAFETTLQPSGLLPLLGGCSMSYLVARLMMNNSIMTEKIARRGLRVSVDYSADALASVIVRDAAAHDTVCLRSDQVVADVRMWLNSHEPGSSHTGFPVIDAQQKIIGVLTRKDINGVEIDASLRLASLIQRAPVVIPENATVREAIDRMVTEKVGRLPLVDLARPAHVTGILTRSDVLGIYGRRLHASQQMKRTIELTRR